MNNCLSCPYRFEDENIFCFDCPDNIIVKGGKSITKHTYYKNFDDVLKDLNNRDDDINKDKNYHWWLGCLDGCQLCGKITVDEKYKLLDKLDKIFKR